jgi:hypothetical protein
MKTFLEFLSDISENLVLKKRPMQDGKFQFVVDSDLQDKRLAGNETYKTKDKIKALGFIWDKSLGKWVSPPYDQTEFSAKMPELRKQVMTLNADFDEKSFGELSDELEDYLELGVTEKLKEFFDELKKKIIEKQNSPEIRAFLNFTLKFTKRSFNNKILIWIQNKNATHVEGMGTWRRVFGRKVKKGAKAIKIWVPITYKSKEEDAPQTDVNTDETRQIMRFSLGNVFDIGDTEPIPGKEHLYTDKEPNWFNDESPDEKTRYIYDALLEFAKEHNIAVSVSDEGLNGARGVSRKGSIQLLQENISTMIHELTHEILHTSEKRKGLSREVLELQAEGVTYLVLKHYGLPSGHAEVYLALWSKDPENMKENDQIIRETAKMFIDYVDEKTMESKSQEEPKAESNTSWFF